MRPIEEGLLQARVGDNCPELALVQRSVVDGQLHRRIYERALSDWAIWIPGLTEHSIANLAGDVVPPPVHYAKRV